MKRVVRVVTRLNRGGPSRQIEALAPRLAERGWSGPVLAGWPEPGEGDAFEDLGRLGVPVLRVPSLRRGLSPRRDARALRELLGLLESERPDILHTHQGKAGALGRRAARRLGIPVVHTFHGHHFDTPGWRGWLVRRVERELARSTDALVALSSRQADDLRRALGPRHAPRIVVIAPALDADAFAAAASAETVQRPAAGRWRVLFLGRLVAVKRVDRLIEATALLRERGRDVELHLAGDGPLRVALEQQARARGVHEHVRFLGTLDRPQPHVVAADVVALASQSEGTPLALLEAMALQRPVVAPAVGGIPDIVSDGVQGRLVEDASPATLAAALEHVLADRARARAMGQAAGRHVRDRFGPERLADETAALYDRLTNGVQGRVPSAP
ncbi:MAG: glycosyltransferase [Planctomycetota bacterium]